MEGRIELAASIRVKSGVVSLVDGVLGKEWAMFERRVAAVESKKEGRMLTGLHQQLEAPSY